jgi:hypothetical protein
MVAPHRGQVVEGDDARENPRFDAGADASTGTGEDGYALSISWLSRSRSQSSTLFALARSTAGLVK